MGDTTNFLRTAASGPEAAIPHLEQQALAANNVDSALEVIISAMAPEDQACAAENPQVVLDLFDSIAAAAVNGVEGIAYEAWLLTQPWGFELSDVRGPVDRVSAKSVWRSVKGPFTDSESVKGPFTDPKPVRRTPRGGRTHLRITRCRAPGRHQRRHRASAGVPLAVKDNGNAIRFRPVPGLERR
ncbi:hypothetical protein [Amycolatopsis sulphurea]|uniref:hypothetical protein n=1 Tax=Amycolatopsis sulphurea TaxID=76022 RepID=UPI00368E56A4